MIDNLFPEKKVISSVCESNEECLSNILMLIGKDRFDLDPTFSKGNFYKGTIKEPKYKFDLTPIRNDVQQADCKNIPLQNNSIESIVFDPPFMFGTHGQTKNNIMNKRFTMFDKWQELVDMYRGGLKEFYRLLKKGSYLIFKCQDYTDSKTTMTHCLIYNWAIEQGFYAQDLFILVCKSGRIYNPNLIQRHARKFHSYYWLFRKGG